jgi:hypothetical protein
MIEIRVHYWPVTPNLRELKIFINNKLELSCFADYSQIANISNVLKNVIDDMLQKDAVIE